MANLPVDVLVGDTLQALPTHLLPPCQYEYKGGARFYGDIVNFKREGKGIMTYPDGDLYEGYFSGGVREGEGTQKWLDGSVYKGPFKGGKRHGQGVHQWVNGEVYEGNYDNDKRQGKGVYYWPNGDKFQGDFVNDQKDGDGVFYFSNGNVYEGEYRSDDRLGQGQLRYKDKTEDVGRWRGCSLIKLEMSVLPASVLDIADKRPDFDLCDLREVTKDFEVKERPDDVGPVGGLETASQAMLLAALRGDSASVAFLLQHMCVRPDVADTNGLTPLLAASVLCHEKVVNILLDNGADVNQLTDAGISPLVACHIHLYCNMQCGFTIAHRREPLCTETGPLEGPLSDFGKEVPSESSDLVISPEEASDKIEVEPPPEPLQSTENCTTIVVYGKRHFLRGEDVLKNLTLPKSVVLPNKDQLRDIIKLLLKRGADPKVGEVPVPALILALLARDVESVELLLKCGADPAAALSEKYGRKSPLHVACTLVGPGAPQIVELLLKANADPNVRDDLSFSRAGALQWKVVDKKDDQGKLLGSTPLQVACSMDQDYVNSTKVIELLLQYGADTNTACSGHSPLTLAIYSGNDAAIALLLKNGADPSFSLGAPIGSALCSAVDTTAEHRRTNEQRLAIINQLMAAGADIMAFVPVSKNGKQQGTAVDYAMNVFYQDKRIAHTPFHALTPAEREIYIARTNLLNHMATLLREEVQRREAKLRLEVGDNTDRKKPKILFKYCYECGRSAGKLCPCTRCYTVSFCSQRCKLKAWTSRHRRECIKLENKRQDKTVKLPPLKKETATKTDTKPTDLISSEELSSILLSSGLSLSTEVITDTLGQFIINEAGDKVYISELQEEADRRTLKDVKVSPDKVLSYNIGGRGVGGGGGVGRGDRGGGGVGRGERGGVEGGVGRDEGVECVGDSVADRRKAALARRREELLAQVTAPVVPPPQGRIQLVTQSVELDLDVVKSGENVAKIKDKPLPKKTSVSKDIFGRIREKNTTKEVITHSLPRTITLQHSQI